MPRISKLSLDQINKQVDLIDSLHLQLKNLQTLVDNIGHQATASDPTHAPATSNNLVFTWTGGTTTLSWPQGYLKSKNWNVQTTARPAAISTAPGTQHIFPVTAGSVSLNTNQYYWMCWDYIKNQMIATQDVSAFHSNKNVHVICQIFTGTAGQTGVAGGGGSTGVSDLSGARYKNF